MEKIIDDVRSIDFENLVSAENVDEAYSNFQSAFTEVIDKHIPLKKRKPVVNPAPYMNKELRQAIYKKRMYHNKFIKYKSDKNWEIYRKQRNMVTKIKRDSIKTYFYERTAGGPKATSFYPTIKQFLSGKTKNSNNNIVLCENDSIVNDQQEDSKMFNEFFINVAKDIG